MSQTPKEKELLIALRALRNFIEDYDEIHKKMDKETVLKFFSEIIDYLEHNLEISLAPKTLNRLKGTILSAGRIGGDTLGVAIVIARSGEISIQLSGQKTKVPVSHTIKNTIRSIEYILKFTTR